jgi:hypothetical protein
VYDTNAKKNKNKKKRKQSKFTDEAPPRSSEVISCTSEHLLNLLLVKIAAIKRRKNRQETDE